MAHVRSVIFNSVDHERIVDFWRALLGVGILKIDDQLGITWLQPDEVNGPTIGIQRVSSRSTSPPNIHLDIAVENRNATKEKIFALGGRLVAEHEATGIGWYIMADPEDNQFCIYHE